MRLLSACTALIIIAVAPSALADPCKAIPDTGPMPSYLANGSKFSGPVVYVGDGDSLCVGVGAGPEKWVEVRLADFYAPELKSAEGPAAKAALEQITMNKKIECVADHQSYDRIVARCQLGGVSLGDRMRSAGITEGGNGRN